MLPEFKDDFWLVSREDRGYYAWAKRESYTLYRHIRRRQHCCPRCDDDVADSRLLVDALFTHGLGIHPLLDIVFAAVARAESRFLTRFVPQLSHEERLTGSLVSEIEAAIHLASNHFERLSLERYGEKRGVDFLYYDLSRGGRLEQHTGADLALILHIDLPDWPRLTRFAAFQAKKLNGSVQLSKPQFCVLCDLFRDAAAYLFYDTDFSSLAPPLVRPASAFDHAMKKKDDTDSFAVTASEAFDGLPLSLWMFSDLARERAGVAAASFKDAVALFTRELRHNLDATGGRLALLTIGQKLRLVRGPEAMSIEL